MPHHCDTVHLQGIQQTACLVGEGLEAVLKKDGTGLEIKLAKPVKTITLKNVGEQPEFDFDPFYISTQSGIHTLDLRELAE